MFDITAGRGDSLRTIRQLSVFLPNQVGILLKVTRALETLGLTLHALSIADGADYAVVRLVVDRPALATELLTTDGMAVLETDLLGVGYDQDDPDALRTLLSRLLTAELNVQYVYPLLARVGGRSVMALSVDDALAATAVLLEGGFELVGQEELE